jgi:hydroxymethylpyrimidine/phosphomethylpyrimidine kinase
MSRPVACIGALYGGTERGLAADVLAARALGLRPLPVCTDLVMASHGRVTDQTEVPADTVSAQLEHLHAVDPPAALRIGALGSAKTAGVVFRYVERFRELEGDAPVILEIIASGPSGETVLDARGIDAVSEHLALSDLVVLGRADAELVTGGEIKSLDDAQVAAQRAANRGARRVLITCGQLPARFFDAADDPGAEDASGDGAPAQPFYSDLYYDGEDFALFEGPAVERQGEAGGAGSALILATLAAMLEGRDVVEALQLGKRFATEAVRHGAAETPPRVAFDWADDRA